MLLGVSLDTDLKVLRKMVGGRGITWPQICDGRGFESELAKLFNVHGTPKFFLLDRNGAIAARHEGEQGKELAKLRRAILTLVAR